MGLMIFKITEDAVDVEVYKGLPAFFAEEEGTVGRVVHEEVIGVDGRSGRRLGDRIKDDEEENRTSQMRHVTNQVRLHILSVKYVSSIVKLMVHDIMADYCIYRHYAQLMRTVPSTILNH